jgi:tetratricopeptide (TPR) repeat protein
LSEQGAYSRAESYLVQAVTLYLKVGKYDLSATAYRELAKVQEAQQKVVEAIANYRKASHFTTDTLLKAMAIIDWYDNEAMRIYAYMKQAGATAKDDKIARIKQFVADKENGRCSLSDIKKGMFKRQSAATLAYIRLLIELGLKGQAVITKGKRSDSQLVSIIIDTEGDDDQAEPGSEPEPEFKN